VFARRCADEIGETWVLTDAHYDTGEDHPRLKRFDAPAYDSSSIGSRIRVWMAYMRRVIPFVLRLKSAPTLYLNSNPPMLALAGYLGARMRGQRYVLRILDVYPDVMVQRGMMGGRNPIAWMWRAFNRIVYGRAAAVVTLGEVMAERIRPYVRKDRPVLVIPTSVDTTAISPLAKADNWFAAEHGLVDDLVVLYSGNYGASHDLSGVIEAMKAFGPGEGVRFLFIGGGGREEELRDAAENHPGVGLHLPFQPRDSLPYSMTSGDIAVVTLGKGTEGISMPSKCYYMMAAGCAILAVSEGDNDLKHVVEAYDCGVNLSCTDHGGIVAAIQRLRDEPEILERYRHNARKAAEEVFDTRIVTEQFLTLFRDLDPDTSAEGTD